MIEYDGGKMLIREYIRLGEINCPDSQYTYFSTKPDPSLYEKLRQLDNEGEESFGKVLLLDREGFNTFQYCEEPLFQQLFLSVRISSPRQQKVQLNLYCPPRFKLWMDGKCIFINTEIECCQQLFLLFNPGIHVLLIEQYSPGQGDKFALQLDEVESNEEPLVWYQRVNRPQCVCEGVYCPDKNVFRLMYLLDGPTKLDDVYLLYIFDKVKEKIFHQKFRFNEVVEISLSDIRNLCTGAYWHEWILAQFTVNGTVMCNNHFEIYPFPLSIYADIINRRVAALPDTLSRIDKIQIQGRMERLSDGMESAEYVHAYRLMNEIEELCGKAEHGVSFTPDIMAGGVHEYYILSELDGSIVWMLLNIPEKYDDNRAYPLFLFLSYNQYSWNGCDMDRTAIKEDFIHVDVSGRGAGSGSYMSEASIMEIYTWVTSVYHIDVNRVYFAGFSSGGFAAWSIAQNYPDWPAAIYPLAGYPDLTRLSNLSNLPIYNLISEDDYIIGSHKTEITNVLQKYGNYHQVSMDGMLHAHFRQYSAEPSVYNAMLENIRDPYPDRIIYSTYRNRYLSSYWLTVNGIQFGEKVAQADIHLTNAHRISAHISGAEGFTLRLPPKVDKRDFQVNINDDYLFIYHGECADQLHFQCNGDHTWSEVDAPASAIDYRKGTGLLDIYLGPLSIVLPDNTDDAILKTARSLSRPSVNGFDSVVYTHYPLYDSSCSFDVLEGRHWAVIDVMGNNSFLSRCGLSLPVEARSDGVVYRGEFLSGRYCLMQAVPQADSSRTCLVIQASDSQSLMENLFTRRIVIPTYSTGLHTYWNNETLLFLDGVYYSIYEANGDLIKI
ncbi:MAG: hypothetical protein HFJ79_02295 [Clostridiales bacterium]|nr:hypothetical protein [Clostridiales bacterium]